MEGKVVQFDYLDKRSQFESEMIAQSSPWSIFCAVDVREQIMLLTQNSGESVIKFPTPEAMRIVAGFLNDHAGKWERGELPGLKAPEKEEGGESCST
jgi:hypothetical protein